RRRPTPAPAPRDLPGLVPAAGSPATSVISATNSLLSLLALKLVGVRRVSHVDDLAADPGASMFAGLHTLPKTAALTSYSYRLAHPRQAALPAPPDPAPPAAGPAPGDGPHPPFHPLM